MAEGAVELLLGMLGSQLEHARMDLQVSGFSPRLDLGQLVMAVGNPGKFGPLLSRVSKRRFLSAISCSVDK